MGNRNQLSFVLEQAILHAIQYPPQPFSTDKSKKGDEPSEDDEITQTIDFLAYHEAVQMLYEEFSKKKGLIGALDEKELLKQPHLDANPNGLYGFNQTHEVENSADSEIIIANHERIILTREVGQNEFHKSVGRLVGANNQNANIDKFLQDRPGVLLQPYELTTVVKKSLLGDVSAEHAYKHNPLHPCFTHWIEPAPVMGFALEGNVQKIIGYVVHAKMLYNLLRGADMASIGDSEFSLKHHMALQYDTQTALRLLNYRYNIDIDKSTLDRITEFDKQIERHSKGACCIEIPNF